MEKSKRIALSITLALLLISTFSFNNFGNTEKAEAAVIVVKVQTWDLVDSGKHLDYGGSSKYSSYFSNGVGTWNNYKSGVIRKDTASTIQDVTMSDYYEVSSTNAYCSSGGTIKFNDYRMGSLSSTRKQNVATHEIGHALGLDHNLSTDVMYKYDSTNTSLSFNDKASYDSAYKKY